VNTTAAVYVQVTNKFFLALRHHAMKT